MAWALLMDLRSPECVSPMTARPSAQVRCLQQTTSASGAFLRHSATCDACRETVVIRALALSSHVVIA